MSTWTSEYRRKGAARGMILGAALVLSGCFELGRAVPDLSPGGTETRIFADPGGLRIVGPHGYCVDTDNTQTDNGAGFVLLGGCDVLANARRGPKHHAILSATYAPVDRATSVGDYAAFFSTPQGLALLSRASDPATVTVLENSVERGVLYLHVRDTSPNEGARLADEQWRAALLVGGYGVMLSVHATASAPIRQRDGRAKISDFVRAVQRAN